MHREIAVRELSAGQHQLALRRILLLQLGRAAEVADLVAHPGPRGGQSREKALVGSEWIQSAVNVKRLDDGTLVASELDWIVYSRQVDETPCDPAKEIVGPANPGDSGTFWLTCNLRGC